MGNDFKSKNSFLEGGKMSHPVNDEILENLYEEVYAELSEKYPPSNNYEQVALDKLSAYFARKRFEDMCQ